MKKLYTRIAACSLAVLIAFNTVAIPKAEAVITESALVSAFVATYSAAAGFAYRGEPFPGTEQMPAVVRSIETFIEDFAVAREMTRAQFEEEIIAGVKFIGDGVVKVGSAAAGLLASFTDWLVDKIGLIGEDGEPVADAVPIPSISSTHVSYGGVVLPNIESLWDKELYPYASITLTSPEWYGQYQLYFHTVPLEARNNGSYYVVPSSTGSFMFYYLDDGVWTYSQTYTWGTSNSLGDVNIWTNSDINFGSGLYFPASIPEPVLDYENPLGDVILSPDYEAAPTVDEQYAMVIDTGMTIEDEQEFVDSVLGAMLAGTLVPTYTIENAAGGDVVVPDEGEDTDTQAGILSSVKNIAQNVIALPQTIAEKIKGIFVPDAALTTEITDAFAAKFSFVPTLHRLGTDLLSIGPDSKPPVVYIHLEDAEGAIDYGGTTKALDMSWYQRYKEDGDRIIGGFLWLGFLWLLFKRVPAIINGGEMVQEYTAAIDRGSKRRKH